GKGVDGRSRPRQHPRAERCPRDEADRMALTIGEYILAGAIPRMVPVLHSHDLEVSLRLADVLDAHLAQADVANELLFAELADRVKLLLARHLGIDAMELPQVDLLDPETLEAALKPLPQRFRAAIDPPCVRPGPLKPGLGRDDEAVGIGVKGLADQLLADMRPIAFSGVDEVDAEFGQPEQDTQRLVPIGRRAPDAL